MRRKKKSKVKIFFLLLSYLIVANIGYNFWSMEKGEPILKAFTTCVIYNMCKQHMINDKQFGVVAATITNEDNPSALIGTQIVHEGDVINGVTVVKIDKRLVHFEKNNIRWSQQVQEKANKAWRSDS